MSDTRLNADTLRHAHLACLIFAALFTVWSVGVFVLVATIDIARPERIGYGVDTTAGAFALWVVWWWIGRAYKNTPRH